MKKHTIILGSVFLTFLFASGCSESNNQSEKHPVEQVNEQYQCPMKCTEEKFEKPGKCTVCGMELEKVANG